MALRASGLLTETVLACANKAAVGLAGKQYLLTISAING